MAHIRIIRSLGILAAFGLATTAHTQDYILSLEGGPAQIDTADVSVTFTIDVIGDVFESTGAEFMLWGAFALETSGSAVVEGIAWTHADWSEFNLDGGYTNDGNYAQVEFGQWQGLDWTLPAESAIGNRIGSFQITLSQSDLSGDFHARLIHGNHFSLSTINVDTGVSYYSTPDSLVLQGFSTNIVPSPSTLAILIGSGIMGMRPRR